jgi:hypothetical protein
MASIKQSDYRLNLVFGQGVSVYSIIRCNYGKRLTPELTGRHTMKQASKLTNEREANSAPVE